MKNHKLCNRIIPLKLLLLIGVKITEAEQAFSLSDEQEITGKLQTNHSYPPPSIPKRLVLTKWGEKPVIVPG